MTGPVASPPLRRQLRRRHEPIDPPGPERPPAERGGRARAAPGRAGRQDPSGPRQSGSGSRESVHRYGVPGVAGEGVTIPRGPPGIEHESGRVGGRVVTPGGGLWASLSRAAAPTGGAGRRGGDAGGAAWAPGALWGRGGGCGRTATGRGGGGAVRCWAMRTWAVGEGRHERAPGTG